MPERFIPEKSEVNKTENSSNNNESNEGSRSHESQGVDDPKQGGKTSNTTRKELDIESENTPLKDGSDEPFKMPNTIEELLDEEVLKDDPETPDVELHEQYSKESDCIVNNTEISNGHLEDSE